MRILFLLSQDLNSPSGLGRYLPMAQGLATHGHEVRVVATHSDFYHLADRQQTIGDVPVNYVAQMHVRKSRNEKAYFSLPKLFWIVIHSSWELTRAALYNSIDLIIVGKPHPMNGLAGLIARLKWNCKLVIDVDDDEAASGKFQIEWQRRLVGWFATTLPKSANWVMTNTHHTQKKLEKSGIDSKKIFYIPNGVDQARFKDSSPEKVNSLRTELNLEGKKIILFAGSLSLSSHPVTLLIEAMRLILPKRRDVVLIFVGGGEDIPILQKQVIAFGLDQQIIFYGRVHPMEIKNFYALADVAVDPVVDDNAARGRCPLKLFESWICGVPFITGDVGDRRLLAGDPQAILLVRPGSGEALANAILEVINLPNLGRDFSNAGRARVMEYTWEYLCRRLDQEIQRWIIK